MDDRPRTLEWTSHGPGLLLAGALALAGACRSAPLGGPVRARTAAAEAGTGERSTRRAKRRELSTQQETLLEAQLALKIAEREAGAKLEDAGLALQNAQRAVTVAERALDQFVRHTRPLAEASQTLALERAERAKLEAQVDLAGILDIYAEEQEARARSEIEERYRRALALAERELELARARLVGQEGDLEAQHATLKHALADARAERDEKKRERETERLRADLTVAEKQHAFAQAERRVKDLERTLEKLEAKADPADGEGEQSEDEDA